MHLEAEENCTEESLEKHTRNQIYYTPRLDDVYLGWLICT